MQEHAEEMRSRPLQICPQCGATNPPDAKACDQCEAKLPGSEVPNDG